MKEILRLTERLLRRAVAIAILALLGGTARPNPVGGTVAQGSATITTSGSQLTIQTSERAQINWSSFNIALGETTTFVQPDSSSVVWNRINDSNPSQILGNLNANGYIILQNAAGFYVGGQAAITAHGVVVTTSRAPAPDFSSAGPWQFDNPPPAASIINYGQIRQPAGDKNGSLFLIAADIENHGTITAPQGSIGLYAGKDVLVSSRPDGRGLSAKVTLPEGSVSNDGQLIADAGTIAIQAQVVNQGGLTQANSMRSDNGVIELVASDSLSLGANSVISAQGDSTATARSPGGFVVLDSGNVFSDQSGSKISVSGVSGGADGLVQVFGSGTDASLIQSSIDNMSAANFASGKHLLINTYDLTLSSAATDTSSSNPNLNVADLAAYSKISLLANDSITLNTIWNLADTSDTLGSLKLQARNSIILTDDGAGDYSGIQAGRNWSLNLVAGTELTSAANIQDGMDRIFVQGLSFIQTQNGSIDLTAGNEIFVDNGARDDSQLPYDISNQRGNGITTAAGGSISVTAEYGGVNTGANPLGFAYQRNAPYYSVSTAPGGLGGISTAAGGDVTISAGGDVTSFLPLRGTTSDAGSGAFGGGNVTVTAGGNVFGHFVVTDGRGTILAGQNAGASTSRNGFALSLVKGSWSVYAPNGNIYLQEVRNPNGTFNDLGGAGNYLFDYDPQASLLLEAGGSVEITGAGLPRGNQVAGQTAPPVILPPSLEITAGSGGVKLDNNVTLFPSPFGELNISTSGNFTGTSLPDGSRPELLMSDSGRLQWANSLTFSEDDHAALPVELNNPNPVNVTVAGSMNNLILAANKQARITVGGDMINAAFSGQNLHPGNTTSIDVAGRIFNRGLYTFTFLSDPIIGADPLHPSQWDAIFGLLVNPKAITNPDPSQDPSNAKTAADLQNVASRVLLFPSTGSGHNPGFVYDPSTLRLGYAGDMSASVRNSMEGTLEILKIGPDGLPVVANGRFVTVPVSFVPKSAIENLYNNSQDVPVASSIAGYQIGGPGQFNVRAESLDLGTTEGILSLGATRNPSLAPFTKDGASVNVSVAGDLSMFTSRIVSLYGGDVSVNCGGTMDLGSQDLFGSSGYAFGIYTSGHSDVSVIARGDININGSRIATYNGGNVFVESTDGSVNAGSGGTTYVSVPIVTVDANTGLPLPPVSTYIYGSGVVTVSLTHNLQSPGGNPLPGNITVLAPNGNIVSQLAGILQLPLDGNLAPGPTITLKAGSPPSASSPGFAGDIDLGDSGVIGGQINMTAQGSIHGLIISRQNTVIQAAQNFSGTVLSSGTADVTAGGTIAGTIAGIAGVTASGGQGITAALMSQNVRIGDSQSQSTFGTSATASGASQAASQQASSDTQKVANGDTDEDDKRKQQGRGKPTLKQHRSRVTVILPKA
jgi:filamentous hemagglutinin family protein